MSTELLSSNYNIHESLTLKERSGVPAAVYSWMVGRSEAPDSLPTAINFLSSLVTANGPANGPPTMICVEKSTSQLSL